MFTDLRAFLDQVKAYNDLKSISGANLKFDIGVVSELSFENQGPALIFDKIDGYSPDFKIAANVCTTRRRSLLALGFERDASESDFMVWWGKRREGYKPIPPKEVSNGPVLENIRTGEEVNLTQFPVPVWHELDGGPYIGTGDAVILRDPETGRINLGTYRVQLHDRHTTGIFAEPHNDGGIIMRKYWKDGKSCPVAVSLGPEPIIFLTASGNTGCPRGVAEYEYAGFICGEPIPVVTGSVTGLPISAHSEIAFEGEIPPPGTESRPEGPFGEWTGYYMPASVAEPVIHVKALYYRNSPVLFGASPLRPLRESYSFSLPMRSATGVRLQLERQGLPVTRVTDLVKWGAMVITVQQQTEDDIDRIMRALDKVPTHSRLLFLVDEDVNPEDPREVLWAVGSRFDPMSGLRSSVTFWTWMLDPLRTTEERAKKVPIAHKRLIINGCRPFHRLKDFPPINVFSESLRSEVWEKFSMGEWTQNQKED